MTGPAITTDPELMTIPELHTHFTHLVTDHIQDVDKRFGDTMEKLDGLDTSFTAKLDGLDTSFTAKLDEKFQELLRRLPPPNTSGRAQRVPLHHANTSTAGASANTRRHDEYEPEYEGEDEYDDEQDDAGEVPQPAAERP
jgi:hypothetical protein